MSRAVVISVAAALGGLVACGRPDSRALQQLACQHVASSIDVQSVSQIDTLRKALGVAPGVDPLRTCRELGVPMGSAPATGAANPTSEGEN
ncbi:MAG: hypothetical protein EBZ51_04565 [Synechococcaceae bacterium WB9_2_112]|nr:hypothetical protein [Synechococcaceae bacterium WB9_2_112]